MRSRFSRKSTSLKVAGVVGALLALGACGRAGLDLPIDDGGFGGGGSPSSSGSTMGSKMTTTSSSGSMVTTIVSSSSVGGAPPCTVNSQCDDGDLCTSNVCQGGLCSFPLRDDDMDGSVAAECQMGGDCNDLNPKTFPGAQENCFDGDDNDCNGVADCFDPACANTPNCGCVPSPNGENCNNGKDDTCDGKADCFDPACVNTPQCGCAMTEAGFCGNGFDEDCDGQTDCDDFDCNADPACQCAGQFEFCDDGSDDDCDGLVDCADADCFGQFPCACIPPGSTELCNNGFDDDCDGKPDCQDPDCAISPSCQMCVSEVCTDGADNNCDGKIDCADPACFQAPNCAPTPEQCNNGLDDDHDLKIDCQDPDCANNPFCLQQQANCLSPKLIPATGGTFTGDTTGHINETKGSCGGGAGEAVFFFTLNDPSFVKIDSKGTSFDSTLYVRTGACNTGHEIDCDDDSGGGLAAELTFDILYPGTYYVFLDGFTVDPMGGANEGPFTMHVQIIPNPPEQCHDGIDNDGDVFVDCADPDCTNDGSCFLCNGGQPPVPEFSPTFCNNGKDDDCDGKADCADLDCAASVDYKIECCDGIDQTGNNITDDFNCRCATDADCQLDPASGIQQLCYTHTVRTCGIPCFFVQGIDICPALAPGSACNQTTQQCEFP